MKLPPQQTFATLRWLADADLSDYRKCGEARFTEIADHYRRDEPWCRIKERNPQTQAILLGLQSELRREALKRAEEEAKQLRSEIETGKATVKTLKAGLRDVVFFGAEHGHYIRAWQAWRMGDSKQLKRAVTTIEQLRAKRKQEQEIAERERRATRRKRDAEKLRHRAPGFAVEVNWFAKMPNYNHWVHNDAAPWGYCQATGQDRWTVGEYLEQKGQKPDETLKRKGAGRPLALYGFETNLLVLDKWLGDWLLNSPHGMAEELPKPERVCEHIAHTLEHAARCDFETVDPDARRFRAVLAAHWRRWWPKMKDDDIRADLEFSGIAAALTANAKPWGAFCAERRARWAEIVAKVRSEPQPSEPMPYREVWEAYRHVCNLLG